MPITKWDTNGLIEEARRAAIRGLHACGVYGVAKIKESMGQGADRTPAPPGDPPNVQTGLLRNSIAYEVDEKNLRVIWGTNVWYAILLELGTHKMPARPFLRPFIDNNLPDLKKLFEQYGRFIYKD